MIFIIYYCFINIFNHLLMNYVNKNCNVNMESNFNNSLFTISNNGITS